MNPEERKAFAVEVASMVLLQIFPQMERLAAAIISGHQRLDAQNELLKAVVDHLHDGSMPVRPRPKPGLTLVSSHPNAERGEG
jgi:hypothetical protein